MLFGCQRFLIAWPLVHKRSVLSGELLPHPLWAWAPSRGGERARTGCALSRLVPVQPLIGMPLADDGAVVCDSLVDCAASSHQLPFFLRQRLQCSSALLTAESAWVLQTHEYSTQAMSARTHSAAHEQHTRRLSASAIHCCTSPSPAAEMANSSLLPCVPHQCC